MSLFSELIPTRTNSLARRSADAEDEAFVVPAYDIKESADAYGVEILVPGVTKDALELQVDQSQLVITARRRWEAPKGWNEVFRETRDADYRLRVDLNESVDVEKINAELEQGVLRVTLPKAEALKPRKISVS